MTELAKALSKVLGDCEKTGLLVQLKGPDECRNPIPIRSSSIRRVELARQTVKGRVGPQLSIYLERELPGAATLDYQPPKKGKARWPSSQPWPITPTTGWSALAPHHARTGRRPHEGNSRVGRQQRQTGGL